MSEPINFKYVTGTPNELFEPTPVYIQDLPSGAVPTASEVTATAVGPGTATDVQGILAELNARITDLEPGP